MLNRFKCFACLALASFSLFSCNEGTSTRSYSREKTVDDIIIDHYFKQILEPAHTLNAYGREVERGDVWLELNYGTYRGNHVFLPNFYANPIRGCGQWGNGAGFIGTEITLGERSITFLGDRSYPYVWNNGQIKDFVQAYEDGDIVNEDFDGIERIIEKYKRHEIFANVLRPLRPYWVDSYSSVHPKYN